MLKHKVIPRKCNRWSETDPHAYYKVGSSMPRANAVSGENLLLFDWKLETWKAK